MGTLVFFEDGFEFGVTEPKPDYEFVLYENVKTMKIHNTSVRIYAGKKIVDYVEIVHDSLDGAKEDLEDIRKHIRRWFKRLAEVRKEKRARLAEEREFRASLLAHLGKLTERIEFDPDVGDEALDAIERCKKRAREGEEE